MTSREKLFGVGKIIWGVAISLATLYIGYAQFNVNSQTIRPSLAVDIHNGTENFRNQHGDLSHLLEISNHGSIGARGIIITVTTKKEGIILHKDSKKKRVYPLAIR